MKMKSIQLVAIGALIVAASLPNCAFAADIDSAALAKTIAAATPGQTVELPAGTYAMSIDLPAGVSLRGAGYGKTIIDATGKTYGIKSSGSHGGSIDGLTVQGATTADISIVNGDALNLQRIRAHGSMIGITVQQSSHVGIENCIFDNNRYGVVIAGGASDSVINCSAVDNTNMGLSFASGDNIVAFNNLSTGSSVAVNVGPDAHNLALDHNLLLGVAIGKAPGRGSPRATMNDWHFVSGLDAHSVSIPVQFADADNGRYVVTNVLDWSPNRNVTAGWGTPKLAGLTSPATDIDGSPRPPVPGVGAFEAPASGEPRTADGTFNVPGGEGLCSAGVFDPSGKLVSYLFQELPLPAGKYPFWLPARTYTGKLIAAGRYEVHVVKAEMKWREVGWFGNTMHQGQDDLGAPCSGNGIAFDSHGHFFLSDSVSDTFNNLRAADAATGKWTWAFWGRFNTPGPALTVAQDGLLYMMRPMGGEGMCVVRINTDTGQAVLTSGPADGELPLGPAASSFTGMTALGNRLCYTDTANNAVRFGTLDSPAPTSSVSVPSPSCPAGDDKTGVVWVISDGKVVGVSPTSSATYTIDTPSPITIAARDGILAVASRTTGKIDVYDVSDPSKPTITRSIGRGDGPDGRILPDRFLFQNNPNGSAVMTIGPDQAIAVKDGWRLQVFNRDNSVRWMTWGHWGGGDVASKSHPGRVYDDWGYSYLADGVTGTWKPESYHRAMIGTVLGDCVIHGQTFALFWGSHFKEQSAWTETVVHFTPDSAQQVLSLEMDPHNTLVMRRDTNSNGMMDDADTTTPVLDAGGKQVSGQVFHYMYNNFTPDGSLISAQTASNQWFTLWKCAGLDSSGVPIYRWADRAATTGADKFISPFNWKQGTTGVGQLVARPGGGWYALSDITSSPRFGKSVFNNGGSDIIGIGKDGGVDWVQTFVQFIRIGAESASNGLCLVGEGETAEFQVINSDGLELQGFSANAPWLDHVQALETFVDSAGRINALVTDCTRSCFKWYRLDSSDIRSSTSRFNIAPDMAATMAALPASPPTFSTGQPPAITFQVPHLSAPLTMDGDLQKWRDAGITPQVVLTPDIGGVGITGGAKDCSLIARYAWEGDNLYFQAFKFDNVIVTDLPAASAYMGDTIEMAVNGVRPGIKFNFSITSDRGQTIYADGGEPYKCKYLSDTEAPRNFKILDDATSVPERSLLESITGLDMSKSKVEYFETKIPIDKATYEGKEAALWDVKPGNSFWVGLQIDDNDEPGGEQCRFISWPLGYGYYNPADADAKAVLAP